MSKRGENKRRSALRSEAHLCNDESVSRSDDSATFEELVAMNMEDRVAYFLRHPVPRQNDHPVMDPDRIAILHAQSIDTIAKREADLGRP